jgi:serine/threonine-protein kinase RsbW
MSNQTYRLFLKSTHEESEKVPDFVTSIQKDLSLDEELASTFMLLLSEAVDNAIQHGNNRDPDKQVTVQIHISESKITATITDEGEGFNPESMENNNPLKQENLLNTGGRGIFLIEELSDSMEYLDDGRALRFILNRQ